PMARLRRPSVRRADPALASRLTLTSVLEPTTREVGIRPVRWSLLALPLVVAGLVFAVREIGRVEKVLAADGSRAARVVLYEIRPGGELRVPIDPGTEVMRVIAHAVKDDGQLAPFPHDGRLLFEAKGEQGTRSDDVAFAAPGTVDRVVAEEQGLAVGDPVAINVDVHGLGAGEMTISLAAIADADAVLVRVYRREAVSAAKAVDRPARLGFLGRSKLATHAGEPDWAELEGDEQAMLVAARWRRVAAAPNANKSLISHAVAIAARRPSALVDVVDPGALTFDLRGDERAAVFAHGKTTIVAKSEGDPEAKVMAIVRHPDGRVDNLEGKGQLEVSVPPDYEVGVELARSTPGLLSVRSSEPSKVEPLTMVAAWRSTKERPYVVTGGASPTIVRVSARRPVSRGEVGESSIILDATITGDGIAQESVMLRASRARSLFDRYDLVKGSDAPTQSAVFHLVLPPHGTLTLTPVEGPIDLSVAELDPDAKPRPTRVVPANGPFPKVQKTGDVEWGGYVMRKPTNHDAFHGDANGHLLLRVPHRFVPVLEPEPKAPSFRIKRPDAAEIITRHGQTFDPSTVTFEIEVPMGEALVLPVRIFTQEKMDVIAKIDGDVPDRKAQGVAERVTTPRLMTVNDEVRSIVVLGDDLPPGKHFLTFVPPPGKKAWIHLPWVAKPHLPGSPPREPHWIEGDLED
ncbi:MAG: hypothetical protein ACXVEE_33960, partial [Polyangiales bacterium]